MTEPERVTCITCGRIDIQNVQGQAAPVCFCRAKIRDELHRAPHLIEHDPCKLIRCDHWKPKGGTEG